MRITQKILSGISYFMFDTNLIPQKISICIYRKDPDCDTFIVLVEVAGLNFDDNEFSMYSYKSNSMPRKENPKKSPRLPPTALTKPEKSINLASVYVVTSEVV